MKKMENIPTKTGLVQIAQASISSSRALPFFISSIHAGFPSPADEYLDKNLDLNELVVQHPAATFYVRVDGSSMQSGGICSGDILVVDRAISPKSNDIAVVVYEGEFAVKRLVFENRNTYLLDDDFPSKSLKLDAESHFEIWGVVTYVIHKTR